MCFVADDYDWLASVQEENDIVCQNPQKCDECGAMIPTGAFAHTVFLQEYETCRDCEDGECSCPCDEDEDPICLSMGCQCEQPSFGETFEYIRCENCDKFLNAISQSEIDAGCHPHETRPAMPMWDDLAGIGRDGCKRYWKKAAKMFPELVTNGHLAKLWNHAF